MVIHTTTGAAHLATRRVHRRHVDHVGLEERQRHRILPEQVGSQPDDHIEAPVHALLVLGDEPLAGLQVAERLQKREPAVTFAQPHVAMHPPNGLVLHTWRPARLLHRNSMQGNQRGNFLPFVVGWLHAKDADDRSAEHREEPFSHVEADLDKGALEAGEAHGGVERHQR